MVNQQAHQAQQGITGYADEETDTRDPLSTSFPILSLHGYLI